jgi:hypothetical protein
MNRNYTYIVAQVFVGEGEFIPPGPRDGALNLLLYNGFSRSGVLGRLRVLRA